MSFLSRNQKDVIWQGSKIRDLHDSECAKSIDVHDFAMIADEKVRYKRWFWIIKLWFEFMKWCTRTFRIMGFLHKNEPKLPLRVCAMTRVCSRKICSYSAVFVRGSMVSGTRRTLGSLRFWQSGRAPISVWSKCASMWPSNTLYRGRVEHLIAELVQTRKCLNTKWGGSFTLLAAIMKIAAHMVGLQERMKGPRYDVFGPWPVCPQHITAQYWVTSAD